MADDEEIALRLDGIVGVQASLKLLAMLFPTKAAQSLNGIAEVTMTDAKENCPVDTGRLMNSGHVDTHATPDDLRAVLTFGTDYAVVQHEDTNLHHPPKDAGHDEHRISNMASEPQRGSKFLSRAIEKATLTFEDDLVKGMGLGW